MTSELTYDADPLTVGFGPIEARGAKQNTEEGHVKTTLAVILLWIASAGSATLARAVCAGVSVNLLPGTPDRPRLYIRVPMNGRIPIFANVLKVGVGVMEPGIKVGQRFRFCVVSDTASKEREEVITRVLSNREEGLSPDADNFVARWVEAREIPETSPSKTLVFSRGTDGSIYLEGRLVSLTMQP